MNAPDLTCEICGSKKFVDAHHYDCREGKRGPETIKLCRRCHRTYHDRGIEWFDDELLDRAIAMENKKRELGYAGLTNPIKPLVLLRREDIVRSSYWNKTHGIRKARKPPRETVEAKQLGFAMIGDLTGLESDRGQGSG